jgi:hypothetical protein
MLGGDPPFQRMASAQALVAKPWWPSLGGNGKSGLDSICIPGVQGNETRREAEKLLCGA